MNENKNSSGSTTFNHEKGELVTLDPFTYVVNI